MKYDDKGHIKEYQPPVVYKLDLVCEDFPFYNDVHFSIPLTSQQLIYDAF